MLSGLMTYKLHVHRVRNIVPPRHNKYHSQFPFKSGFRSLRHWKIKSLCESEVRTVISSNPPLSIKKKMMKVEHSFFLKKMFICLFVCLEDKYYGDHLFRQFFSFLQQNFKPTLCSYFSPQWISKDIDLLLIKNTEHMNLGCLPENAASNWLLTNFYQKSGCKK